MRNVPRTTLEQWAVLRAVIDAGGFVQAAEMLNRSASSISYAVARLHDGIGVELIVIEGRKARLTPTGRTLLTEVTPLIDGLLHIENRARTISVGVEAEITIVIDSLFPRGSLFAALCDLERDFPETVVNLRRVPRLTPERAAARPFDLAVMLWDAEAPANEWMIDIELVAVARPDHPLARSEGAVSVASLMRHRAATIAGGPASSHRTDATFAVRQWYANSVEDALDMIGRGLCWGWLPAPLVAEDLASGRLQRLHLAGDPERDMRLCLVLADRAMAGPATRALADRLHDNLRHQLRRSA